MNSVRVVSKKCIAVLLALVLIASAGVLSYAADGFRYTHDPLENPSAVKDIIADENAVYGYRPSDTGSLKIYADADWSDPDIVASGRTERVAYHKSIESMYDILREMREHGKNVEEIARAVSTRRNAIRLEAYVGDPEGLAEVKARNLEKYGHEEGPLPEELYEKYGSWERVIEKAFSTNAGMDACLGLYDDYYFLYVAQGDVPADVTITVPEGVLCGIGNTAEFKPEIETNALSYSVRYESADPETASIDENGTVRGLRFGETGVRCIVTDAGGNEHFSEWCEVVVGPNILVWIERILISLAKWFATLFE